MCKAYFLCSLVWRPLKPSILGLMEKADYLAPARSLCQVSPYETGTPSDEARSRAEIGHNRSSCKLESECFLDRCSAYHVRTDSLKKFTPPLKIWESCVLFDHATICYTSQCYQIHWILYRDFSELLCLKIFKWNPHFRYLLAFVTYGMRYFDMKNKENNDWI